MKQSFKTLGLVALSVVGFTACDGLKKLVKNSDTITYTTDPEVLAVHGDSISFTISGSYPEKVFPKKATVSTTPVLVYDGGEVAFDEVVLIGEQVEGKGQKISNATGGSFSYSSNRMEYTPEMKNSILELRATGQVKEKKQDLDAKKIADGVITTALLVQDDDKVIMAKDKFTKEIKRSHNTNVYFPINSYQVRFSELKGKEIKELKAFVLDAKEKGAEFTGMSVSAYASPDGELSRNENLAEHRAKSTTRELKKILSYKGISAAKADDFYSVATTAEDWEGFKTAMEASSIEDKELILRVLTMYPDGETREREIKNLSATYVEVAQGILPKLRRSVLTMNVVEKSRTDAEISKLVKSNPDTLSVEEILYAATLVEDLGSKLDIYLTAEKIYPKDWRTANNVGYVYLLQNSVEAAEAAFERADALEEGNVIVKNNLGAAARRAGKRTKALELLATAEGAGDEVAYNVAIIELQNGNYDGAVSKFGSSTSFNAALAKLLSGDADGALTAISSSSDKDAGMSLYLKAVIGARKSSIQDVITNLKEAIEKDGSFKQMAVEDKEFLVFADNEELQVILGLSAEKVEETKEGE